MALIIQTVPGCSACGDAEATQLCDWPIVGPDGYRRIGLTCSRPLCSSCSVSTPIHISTTGASEMDTIDQCPHHEPIRYDPGPQKPKRVGGVVELQRKAS